MRRSHAKALSVLLSFVLALSSLPAPALAEMAEEALGVESQPAAQTAQPESGADESAETPAPPAETPAPPAETPAPPAQTPAPEDEMGEAPSVPSASESAADSAPTASGEMGESSASDSQPQPVPTPNPAPAEIPERAVTASITEVASSSPANTTNDELFAAYAQHLIDESIPGTTPEDEVNLGTQSASDGLTGPNLVCYNTLKTLVQRVAAGDATDATASVKCSDLGVDSFGPWTADDLGVPSVSVNGYVPRDAFAKVRERLGFDSHAVFVALLADCPYDLYWFDATATDALSLGMTNIKVRSVDGQDALYVEDALLTFDFRVAQEYHPSGSTKKTEADPSKIAAVKAAVTKARGIVFDPNKANMSVRERLAAYKDAICAEVSYNRSAADDDSTPYGNPWQLVWVFDGDPSTNVVCEGYAKAFKYLCDLTWPNREGGVECLRVTGDMNGGTGAGRHMWNVVRMDDGRNYLVDVTNCDGGTVGAPDKLFLACGPTGSYDESYTFALSNAYGITYAYDSDTRAAFGREALTISAQPYASPSQPMAVEPPTPATDLVYNAREQAGVAENVWYSLSGTVSATAVGNYTATATLAQGCKWNDGTTAPKTISWSIARRPVTVTADYKSKVVGGAEPQLTATVDGTLGSDTVSYTLTRAAGETPGKYAITPSGQATQGNYSVTFVPGRFTIRSAASTVLHSGVWGTCPWEITDNGTLTVYPGTGESQSGTTSSPWYDYKDSITVVCLDSVGASKVVLPECSQCLFYGLSEVKSMDLSGADTSRVTDMAFMFGRCSSLTTLDVSGFDTSKVTDMHAMFNVCSELTSLNLNGLDTSQAMDMGYMFSGCTKLPALDVSGFDTSKVVDMGYMFYHCSELTFLAVSGFNTSQVTNLSYMFGCCPKLASLDVSGFDTSQAMSMRSMFYQCSSLTTLDVSGFDTSRVTDMRSMFYECSSLAALNVSGFDTSRVTDMAFMFDRCSSVTSLDVSRFNTSRVTDMSHMFYGCSSLPALNVTSFDTSSVTTMRFMFSGCSSLPALDVSRFNTSQVTDMSSMFRGCSSLPAINLSSFDTSSVTDMRDMFAGCSSLTALDLSGFDTAKVTDMGYLFWCCSSLTSLDLSVLNTAQVTDMGHMFYGCSKLASLNVSGLNTSSVTDMRYMFEYCSSLEALDLSGFDTSSVTRMSWMFNLCTSLVSLDLTGWSTQSIAEMDYVFGGCSSLARIKVGTGVGQNLLEAFPRHKINETYDWYSETSGRILSSEELVARGGVADTYSKGPYVGTNIGGATISFTAASEVYDGTEHSPTPTVMLDGKILMPGSDYYLTYDNNVDAGTATVTAHGCGAYDGSCSGTFEIARRPVTVTADSKTKSYGSSDPSLTATVNGTLGSDTVSYTLSRESGEYTGTYAITPSGEAEQGNYAVTFVPGWLTIWGNSSMTLHSGTWGTCQWKITADGTLTVYPGTGESQAGKYYSPWSSCSDAITSVVFARVGSSKVTLPAYSWNLFSALDKVTTMDLSGADTSNVTNMNNMFSGCSKLTSLDLSGLSTSQVTSMAFMFSGCSSLASLNLFGWDTSNVTNMARMFNNCSSLASLDVSGFNTSRLTSVNSMFFGCTSLASLDLSGFDTSKVTDMISTFSGCSSLSSLNLSGWNTSSVTDMSSMFYNCSKLSSLDLSGFSTSQVTNMGFMFSGCSSLSSLSLSGWDTSSVTSMSSMFYGCSSLPSLNVTSFDTSSVTSMSAMFSGCSSLPALDVSRFNTSRVADMGFMFSGCSSLPALNVTSFDTSNVTSMRYMFSGCSSLSSLDVTHFKTSQVTSMGYMFWNCSSLPALDITHFDTSSVTDMGSMFYGCSKLTSLDLSSLSTSQVTDMGSMFEYCSSLGSLGLSHFNTSQVTSMIHMFSGCTSLATLNLSGWDTSNVGDMRFMFSGCSSLASLDVTGWSTSSVEKMGYIFSSCSSLAEIKVGTGVGSNLLGAFPSYMVNGTSDWRSEALGRTVSGDELLTRAGIADTYTKRQDAGSIDISGATVDLTGVSEMYDGTEHNPTPTVRLGDTTLTSGDDYYLTYASNVNAGTATVTAHGWGQYSGNCSGTFEIARRPVTVTADDKSKVVGEADPVLTATVQGILGNDTVEYSLSRSVGDDPGTYAIAPNGQTVQGNYAVTFVSGTLTIWRGSSTTLYSGTWGTCPWEITEDGTLTVYPGTGESQSGRYYSPWSSYSNSVTSVRLVAEGGRKVVLPADSQYLFLNLSKVSTMDLAGADTSQVTDMVCMFCSCPSLVALDLSGFDTTNVTDMSSMFDTCPSLEVLNLSSFNTSNVTVMSWMFYGCTSLASLDLTGFDTSRVTSMYGMFYNCTSLSEIVVGNQVGANLLRQFPTYEINGVSGWYSRVLGREVSGQELYNRQGVADTYSKRQSAERVYIDGATVDLTGVSEVYDGTEHSPTPTVMLDGKILMPGSDYYLTYDNNVDAGTATVTAHGCGAYDGNCSGTFEIARRTVTVTADDKSKMVGEIDPTLTATVQGTLGDDTVDFVLYRAWGNDPGTYAIVPYGQTVQGNYAVTFVSGTFTIRGASSSVISSGTWGTCPWEITDDGTLTVHPGTGESQSNRYSSPWSSHSGSVTAVRLVSEGGRKVVLPECSNYLFCGLSNVSSMDLSGVDTSQVTDMSRMFYCCQSLTSLDLSAFRTSNVTDMISMFEGCSSLGTLDLSGFKTYKVTNMSYMFWDCLSLTSLDLSGFSTSSVTYMYNVFYDCMSLSNIKVGSGIGTNMLGQFPTYEINGVSGWYSEKLGREVSGVDLTSRWGIADVYSKRQAAGPVDIGGATVDLTGVSEVYDGSTHTPMPVVTLGGRRLTFGDDYYLVYGNNKNAGTATVTVYGCGAYGGSCSGTFQVARRPVTVTADDKTKVAGEADPVLTATVQGIIAGDMLDYSLSREPGKYAGSYAITPSGLVEQGNYVVTYVPGTLTIRDPSTVLRSGFWGTCHWEITVGGTLTVHPGTGESQSSRYSSPWTSYADSITAVRLVSEGTSRVVLPECSRYLFYGLSKVSTMDLAGADTSSVTDMTGMFWNCTLLSSLDVSSFDTSKVTSVSWMFDNCMSLSNIKVGSRVGSSLLGAFPTYTINGVSGWYSQKLGRVVSGADLTSRWGIADTYSKRQAVVGTDISGATVDLRNVSVMYDGNAHTPSPVVRLGGKTLVLGSDYYLTYDNNKSAGTATVTAHGRGSYRGSCSGSFTIARRLVTVTADSKTKAYGSADPALTATVRGVLGRDTVSYFLKRAAGVSPGKYAIKPSGEAVQGNYDVTFVPGALTITKAASALSARMIAETVDCARGTTSSTSNVTVTGAAGAVTYANASQDAAAKGLSVDARTGCITVPVGSPVGAFSMRVRVTDAGDANREAGTKYVTYTVRVTFPDVAPTAWYANVVWRAAEIGLINGYKDGRFGPADNVTRGQVAVILWNMAGKPGPKGAARSFPDVVAGKYYYEAVAWASSVGVVNGYKDGTFGPDDLVTREQLAAMLANYAGKVAGKDTSGSAADYKSMKDASKVSSWAARSVGWCFKNKILSGTKDGRVNPQGNATRAETAKMVVFLHDLL